MIDLHTHVLPGIDDGPETIEGSIALARAAAAAGTHTIVATPHVNWRFPNDAETIGARVQELNARLAALHVGLELRAGSEIAMTHLLALKPKQLWRLGLGGGRWLLIEPPFTTVATNLDTMLFDLVDRGHRILLAHPERCPAFHRDRAMLAYLVERGVATSLTAGSLAGRFGEQVRRFSLELFRAGLVHNVASDAHDTMRRPPGIATELQQADLGVWAEWLTESVPAAILSDADAIPPRPKGLAEVTIAHTRHRSILKHRRA